MSYGIKKSKLKEKSQSENPYYVDGRDMSKVPIYYLEEEDNGLTEDQEIALWQYGVDTGVVWQLQGWYGRNASEMIEAGILTHSKKQNYDYYGNKLPVRKTESKEETEEYFLGKDPKKHKDYKYFKGEK